MIKTTLHEDLRTIAFRVNTARMVYYRGRRVRVLYSNLRVVHLDSPHVSTWRTRSTFIYQDSGYRQPTHLFYSQLYTVKAADSAHRAALDLIPGLRP